MCGFHNHRHRCAWRCSVPEARCQNKKCRSRNPRAVWAINGRLYCHFCGEREIELHGMEELRINRLSDNEFDFSEPDYKYRQKMARA